MDVVFADELGGIGLIDGALERFALADVFAAHVDEASMRTHRERGNERAFDQEMSVVAKDFAVLAGARLRLVGVDDEIARPRIGLRHERPLEARRESGAAATAEARLLHLVDDVVVALVDEELRAVPDAAALRAFEAHIVEAIDIAENAVAIIQHARYPFGLSPALLSGRQPEASFCACSIHLSRVTRPLKPSSWPSNQATFSGVQFAIWSKCQTPMA